MCEVTIIYELISLALKLPFGAVAQADHLYGLSCSFTDSRFPLGSQTPIASAPQLPWPGAPADKHLLLMHVTIPGLCTITFQLMWEFHARNTRTEEGGCTVKGKPGYCYIFFPPYNFPGGSDLLYLFRAQKDCRVCLGSFPNDPNGDRVSDFPKSHLW